MELVVLYQILSTSYNKVTIDLTHWPLKLIRAVLPIMLISHIPMVRVLR